MKQCITPQQPEELTPKGKQNLLDYWSKKRGHGQDGAGRYTDLPWLSIGHMIDFLEEYTKETGFYRIHFAGTPIQRRLEFIHYKFDEFDRKYEAEELCDALWEAVKEILET